MPQPQGAPTDAEGPSEEAGAIARRADRRRADRRVPANVAGGLAYALGPLTAVLFLLDRRPFVRFHALQCLGLAAAGAAGALALDPVRDALARVAGPLGTLGVLAAGGLFLLGLAFLWLRLVHRAFRGEAWPLPWVGARLWRAVTGSRSPPPPPARPDPPRA